MEEQNYPDKITFKLKFLDEYHDIVIDWNDDKHEHLSDQLFEQIAEITGIPSKYTKEITLFDVIDRLYNRHYDMHRIENRHCNPKKREFPNYRTQRWKDYLHLLMNDFQKLMICDAISRHNHRFVLQYSDVRFHHECKHYAISYNFLVESMVPTNGECSLIYCQTRMTKNFCDKLATIIHNDKLNAEVAKALMDNRRGIFGQLELAIRKEFNVIQFDNFCRAFTEGNGIRTLQFWYGYLRDRG